MSWIQYTLLGIGVGSAYVLLAQGIVLIYRASGVVNFAHGGLAMVAAYLYNVEFRSNAGWSVLPSLIASVLIVTVVSALIHAVIMRPLRESSALTRVIATLGILIVLQSVASIRWGTASVGVEPVLPAKTIKFGDQLAISSDRVWLFVIALGVTAALSLHSRLAVSGIATRAAAENQRAASSLGWSPDALAIFSWMGGGALAALAGILITPYAGLNITTLTLVVIAALAGALIGDFSSFWVVAIGALALGIIRSLLVGPLQDFMSIRGAEDAVPFAVILVVMVIRGRGIPMRGAVAERLPSLGSGLIKLRYVLPGFAVAMGLVLFVFSDDINIAAGVVMITALIMLSIVVLTGFTGQLSLAQFALAGLGGIFGTRLAAAEWHWPFLLDLVVGTIGAAFCGVLLALPALRTRGVNLAVITLGLGLAVQALVFNNTKIAGGVQGVPIDPPSVFGYSIDPILNPRGFTAFTVVAFALVAIAVANLRRGPAGRRLIAVRTNERAASSLGVDVTRAKIFGFAISAGIAGLGGTLWSFQSSVVLFGTGFQPTDSINAVGLSVAGGVGWVMGPVLGALLTPGGPGRVISEHLVSVDSWIPLIGGVVLILILITNPNGQAAVIAGQVRRVTARLRRTPAVEETPTVRGGDESEPTKVQPRDLVVDGLVVRYGGVVALDKVSLTVRPGMVVGLMGPNGAGKTTLIDAVSGFVKPAGGTLAVGDDDITTMSPHRRARLGVSRSFQSLELFDDVTVRENLMAAADEQTDRTYLTDLVRPAKAPFSEAAAAAVREFGLTDVLDKKPDEIPYGTRRLVAIARAVAASPSILLLDEPGAGLDEYESAELGRLVRRLADRWGMAVLLIEHDVRMLMETCDRITVLDFGKPIFEGTPDEVANDPGVVAAYLGQAPDTDDPTTVGGVVEPTTVR